MVKKIIIITNKNNRFSINVLRVRLTWERNIMDFSKNRSYERTNGDLWRGDWNRFKGVFPLGLLIFDNRTMDGFGRNKYKEKARVSVSVPIPFCLERLKSWILRFVERVFSLYFIDRILNLFLEHSRHFVFAYVNKI